MHAEEAELSPFVATKCIYTLSDTILEQQNKL